jgi:hypothetical protein
MAGCCLGRSASFTCLSIPHATMHAPVPACPYSSSFYFLPGEFNDFAKHPDLDLCPPDLADVVEEVSRLPAACPLPALQQTVASASWLCPRVNSAACVPSNTHTHSGPCRAPSTPPWLRRSTPGCTPTSTTASTAAALPPPRRRMKQVGACLPACRRIAWAEVELAGRAAHAVQPPFICVPRCFACTDCAPCTMLPSTCSLQGAVCCVGQV